MSIKEEYQIIKGRVTAEDILKNAKEKGLKKPRGAEYSIHIVRAILSGRGEDKDIGKIVTEFRKKLEDLELV